MADLAAPFIHLYARDHKAYWAFRALMTSLRDNFAEGLAAIRQQVRGCGGVGGWGAAAQGQAGWYDPGHCCSTTGGEIWPDAGVCRAPDTLCLLACWPADARKS